MIANIDEMAIIGLATSRLEEMLAGFDGVYSSDLLENISTQCRIGKGTSIGRYGNIREQFSRLEAAIKTARKHGNMDDVGTAVNRIRSALDIHVRATASSTSSG